MIFLESSTFWWQADHFVTFNLDDHIRDEMFYKHIFSITTSGNLKNKHYSLIWKDHCMVKWKLFCHYHLCNNLLLVMCMKSVIVKFKYLCFQFYHCKLSKLSFIHCRDSENTRAWLCMSAHCHKPTFHCIFGPFLSRYSDTAIAGYDHYFLALFRALT